MRSHDLEQIFLAAKCGWETRADVKSMIEIVHPRCDAAIFVRWLILNHAFHDDKYYSQRVLSDKEYSSSNRTKSSIPFIDGEKDHMS